MNSLRSAGLIKSGRLKFQNASLPSFTHFATFNFNRSTTLRAGLAKLKDFHARWDRKVLGKKFNHQPLDKRTFMMAFPEHLNSNLHYHVLVRSAVKSNGPTDFRVEAPEVWKQIIPSGQLFIPLITMHSGIGPVPEEILIPEQHQERIARYITKDIDKTKNYDNFVTSHEFLAL